MNTIVYLVRFDDDGC